MEAMYFAVGVLTMVLLAVASLAVYSTVMVLKLKKRYEEHTHYVYDEIGHIQRTIDNRIRETARDMHEIGDQMLRNHDSLRSYVDHRFDKMIDTYLLVKETEKETKKIIKG